MSVHGRGRYPRPPTSYGTLPRPLRRRLVVLAYIELLARVLLGLLARQRQQVEGAFDARDHAGGDTGVARCRVQLVVTQKRLDFTNVGTVLEQVGREAVAQRMQRHALLDPGRIGCLMEQAIELASGHRLTPSGAGKQPAFRHGRSGIVTRWARLPPLTQQFERLR